MMGARAFGCRVMLLNSHVVTLPIVCQQRSTNDPTDATQERWESERDALGRTLNEWQHAGWRIIEHSRVVPWGAVAYVEWPQ